MPCASSRTTTRAISLGSRAASTTSSSTPSANPIHAQVEAQLSPLIGSRNTLAHTKEAQIADKVRRSGETELRWFVEKLGLALELVPPPRL
jgi:hypothetical protein